MFAKVRFQVTAGLYNDFLNYLLDNDYQLFDIVHIQFGFIAICYAEDYKAIAAKARRFQCKARIIQKKGIYFKLFKLLKRKGLAAGAVLFMVLSYIFSHMIWDININSGDSRLKNSIASRLYRQNIYAGTFYTEEKLENAKEHILLINEDLGYLTLNFYKGVLTCEVYPRTDRADYISDISPVDICASQSGIITDLRVYSGFSQVELGQSVSQGDILVSHMMIDKHGNFYTSQTRAYIEATGNKAYSVFIPFRKETEVLTGIMDKSVWIDFLGKEYTIHTADTARWENSLEKTKIEYFSFLGFRLPLTVKTTVYYQLAEVVIESDTLTARNLAKLQIQHMIENDDKLKTETDRRYDYIIKDDGIQLNCIVTGNYEIT